MANAITTFLKRLGVSQSPFVVMTRDTEEKLAEQYLTAMLLTTLILGTNLKFAKRFPGEVDWEDACLKELFDKLINDPSNQENKK